MTHDELLAKIEEKRLEYGDPVAKEMAKALRAVVELPNEITIERQSDELMPIGHSDKSYMQGYKYAMYLVIQAIEKELK